jgi:secreted trypsin-like serine protease
VCGDRNPEGKTFISNGAEVKVGDFPWHVGIYKYSDNDSLQQICGGSLISPNTVVSGMSGVIFLSPISFFQNTVMCCVFYYAFLLKFDSLYF